MIMLNIAGWIFLHKKYTKKVLKVSGSLIYTNCNFRTNGSIKPYYSNILIEYFIDILIHQTFFKTSIMQINWNMELCDFFLNKNPNRVKNVYEISFTNRLSCYWVKVVFFKYLYLLLRKISAKM